MLIIMTGSTAALLLVSGGFATYEYFTRRDALIRDLSGLAGIIGDRSTAALTFDNPADAEETLRALSARKNIRAAALYDQKGRLFAQYPDHHLEPGLFPETPEVNSQRFEKNRFVIFRQIRLNGEVIGTVYLNSDLQESRERMLNYARMSLLMLLASLAATYLLSARLQRIISRPISHLAGVARGVSLEKDYSVRAIKHGHDELGQLIDGFNEMLGQIQQRDAALQESHTVLEKRVAERTQHLQEEIAERRRAENALQQQFMRISLINQTTRTISERQDFESILHVVLRLLQDHLGLDLGSVALYDEQADTLNLAAQRLKNPLLSAKLKFREGAVMPMADTGLLLCKEGQTVYFADTLKSPSLLAEQLVGAGLRCAVVVPLLVDHKLFGVVLAARLQPDSFSSGDSEFLRMLSEHVALAAHQARLHSELERAYNELRQTQQTVMQQERLKALGQMASGIAHDINNALSPVVGFSELLMRGEKALTESGKKHLQYIRTAGEDIAHIVARLREFYRRREDTEHLQKINLNTLAEQVIDMTRPRWRDIPQSRGITVETIGDFTPGVPDLIGIESEIREALTNLVLNAVDALPDGGKITLRTRVFERDICPGSSNYPTQVVVEVSDTGIGMDEDTRKRCLEPFFSTKGKRGTGLGLAMVYGVMERHEGRIEIASEPGRGTTFRLFFPVRNKAQRTNDSPDDYTASSPLQILCIDDEPLLRDLLKEMLEREGHAVEVCDGGQSGLEAFRQARQRGKPFDVVITDLGMPYVDGRQVAKVLKQESPGTPIVMLTGWGAFMKDDTAAPVQVDSVLSKPPRSKELRETLSRFAPSR